MAMGSYFLGSVVRVPLQVLENGMALPERVYPKIKMIVKPDGTQAFSGTRNMNILSLGDSTYYFDYTPDSLGDFVVIMTYELDGLEFTAIENFTVNSKTNMVYVPRAESR